MARHWREKVKDKAVFLKDEKQVHRAYWVGIIVLFIALVTTHAFVFSIGFTKGEKDCKAVMRDIERLQLRARALVNETAVLAARKKHSMAMCAEIGAHINKKGQVTK